MSVASVNRLMVVSTVRENEWSKLPLFGTGDTEAARLREQAQNAMHLARRTSDNLTLARLIELAKEYISQVDALEKTKRPDATNVGKRADKRPSARIERESVEALTRNAISSLRDKAQTDRAGQRTDDPRR
jgi:hypothetical protein